jgi:hypothetical protein
MENAKGKHERKTRMENNSVFCQNVAENSKRVVCLRAWHQMVPGAARGPHRKAIWRDLRQELLRKAASGKTLQARETRQATMTSPMNDQLKCDWIDPDLRAPGSGCNR